MSHYTKLYGTGVALVTPFNNDETIDFISLEKIINHVINGGVDYIVTLGTTGETPTLSKQEKIDIINFTFRITNERVPIVIGIGGASTADVLEALKELPTDQALAILSVSPFYNKPSQEGIYQHYKKIAEATTKPIILYNVPGRTGRNVTTETTIRLANEFKHIIAVKEASGDMAQCMEIVANAPEHFIVISGDDNLCLAQIACGMKGVISVAANYFAKDFSQMVNFCLNGEFEAARSIQFKLLPAYNLMFDENNPAGIKAFMVNENLCENYFRLPVVPVSENCKQNIENFIKHYK
jgi:4-hydroxy-tetrahydrodipicolinate synthase